MSDFTSNTRPGKAALDAALAPLIAKIHWVTWKYELPPGATKKTKVPYQTNPRLRASTNKPNTWTTYAAATRAAAKFDGIGFVLTNSGIAAFDIDHCRNAETGEIHPWALSLVERCNSYAEITPSGTGLRIIGSSSGDKLKTAQKPVPGANGVTCEIFRNQGYITVTGQVLKSAPLVSLDEQITTLLQELEQEEPRSRQHDEPIGAGLYTKYMPKDLPPGEGRGISNRPEDNLFREIKLAGAVIPNNDLAWDDWNYRGMVLFASTGGGDEGKAVFHKWSSKSQKYNEATTNARWEAYYNSPTTQLHVGTWFYMADQADPEWRQSRKDNEQTESEGEQAEAEPEEQTSDDGLPAAHHHGETENALNRHWLIKNLLPQTGVGLLSGQWGTGKTFTALDIAGSLMPEANQDFFIDYRVKRKGGVLFIAAEGSGSIALRFEAMLSRKLGNSLLEQSNPPQPFAWLDLQPQLLKLGAKNLIAIARREAAWMQERHNADLVLIVIDTVAAAAAFQREDDAAQAQAVMGALGDLSRATGALVLGVDHFGKDVETGTRGSSAKEAYTDFILALLGKREVTGRITELRMGVRKVREGEQGRIIPFRLEVIDCGTDEDGDAVTTRIVHWEPERQVPHESSRGRPRRGHAPFSRALHTARSFHCETIRPNGVSIQVARVNAVREEFFRNLTAANADLTDHALKLRWQRAKKAALEDGVAISYSFEGGDYLTEGFREPM